MKRIGLVVGLLVVAFACSEQAGQMLTDAGQMMMDAGDMMQPDAGADAGSCEVCEQCELIQCVGLQCVGAAITDPKIVCATFETYSRYQRYPNNTVLCVCNDNGGICGDQDYACGTTCRTDLLL